MSRTAIVCYVFAFFQLAAEAQNLVPNPGFETYSTCPDNTSEMDYAVPWMNPCAGGNLGASPDFFNACCTVSCAVGVPSNRFSPNNPAHSGTGYAGFLTYYDSPPGETGVREYIRVKLTETLLAGQRFEFSMWVQRTPYSNYASELGAHLTADSLVQETHTAFDLVPNLAETPSISDSVWRQVSGTYIATGGERFLTIGNFRTNENTTLIPDLFYADWCSSLYANYAAYYFVDDIYLAKEVETGISSIPSTDFLVSVSEVSLNIRCDEGSLNNRAEIFSIDGRLLLSQHFSGNETKIEKSRLSGSGLLIVRITRQGKLPLTKKVLIAE